jgi:hypothetical protein
MGEKGRAVEAVENQHEHMSTTMPRIDGKM